MTRGPIWGNRNRTKECQNLKSSSELTYRMYKLCKLLLVCIGYSTIETKEAARIGYNGFLFPHSYSGDGLGRFCK
jgi:hypothetical protein